MFDFIFMTVCDFAECMFISLKRKCGDLMFFSKTEQFDDIFAKTSPIWIFGMTPSFSFFFLCLCLPDVSSLPNLMVVIFFSCNVLLHVLYIETTLSICVWYILWGDQTRKRVFLRFRDTVFQSEERTEEEEVWRHQQKSVNILLLSFCAAKSYEFVSFIQKKKK